MKTYFHNGIRILYNTDAASRFNMHKAHFHDEYEIYYLLSGSRQFYINDRVYPINSSSLAFVDGETMHRTFSENEEPHTRIVVCVKKSKLQKDFPMLISAFSGGGVLILNPAEQEKFRFLFDMLKNECENCRPMQHEAISSITAKLFIDVFRLVNKASSVENDCCSAALNVINYINTHYSKKFTLEDISKDCNISVSHLTRLFKISTGYSVIEYANNLRIKKAAELIKSTNLSISEIATRTGFSSFSYFGKMFSECYGVSPLKYRKSS